MNAEHSEASLSVCVAVFAPAVGQCEWQDQDSAQTATLEPFAIRH